MKTKKTTKSKSKGRPLISSNGKFKPRNKVIWDSGFGYELGVFVHENEDGGMCTIELRSGNTCYGYVSVTASDIKPYSNALATALAEKYGYVKVFRKALSI